jgi:hypothetical protein
MTCFKEINIPERNDFKEPFTYEGKKCIQDIIDSISDYYRHSVDCQQILIYSKFRVLYDTWYEDTLIYSSVDDICEHPAYSKLIDLGIEALPHILAELRNNPGHLFLILPAITGENPIPEADRGYVTKMREYWLEWGKLRGYIE